MTLNVLFLLVMLPDFSNGVVCLFVWYQLILVKYFFMALLWHIVYYLGLLLLRLLLRPKWIIAVSLLLFLWIFLCQFSLFFENVIGDVKPDFTLLFNNFKLELWVLESQQTFHWSMKFANHTDLISLVVF